MSYAKAYIIKPDDILETTIEEPPKKLIVLEISRSIQTNEEVQHFMSFYQERSKWKQIKVISDIRQLTIDDYKSILQQLIDSIADVSGLIHFIPSAPLILSFAFAQALGNYNPILFSQFTPSGYINFLLTPDNIRKFFR